jgi:hypothetical protein
VDWDWEDGPPRETPPSRRAAGVPGPAADEGPPKPERPGPEAAEPLDESVTQVFSADAAWEQSGGPSRHEPEPHDPTPEYVLPDRTETGRPTGQGDREFAYLPPEAAEPDTGHGRRPRSPQDRAARREQRRRQLRRRRIVALLVLIAIVVLVVVLIVRGCGGSDVGAASALMLVVDGRFLAVTGRR